MRIVFLTFGNSKFAAARDRIRNEATSSGWFTHVVALSEFDLPSSVKNYCDINANVDRGYGCYIWKPIILQMISNTFSSGETIVFYVDSGCWLNRFGNRHFQSYLRKMDMDHPFLCFERTDYQEQQCTKKGVFDELGVEWLRDSRPIMAGVFGVLLNEKSRKIIDEWVRICVTKPYLLDQSPSLCGDEFPLYEINRNEQGIFSLLLKKHQVYAALPAEHILPEVHSNFEDMSLFPFIARRSRI